MERHINFAARSFITGLSSILLGLIILFLGYFLFPGKFSGELLEVLSVVLIESIPTLFFGVGLIFSVTALYLKDRRYGSRFTLMVNIIPLAFLIYIMSE